MREEERTELIEALISGKLSEAQRLAVEKLQEEDPSFASEVAAHRELQEAIGPSKLNDFRALTREVIREESTLKTAPFNWKKYRWLLAASFLTLLALAYWLWPKQQASDQQLFTEYFEPPEVSSVFRNAENSTFSDLQNRAQKEIDSLYQVRNYAQALRQLDQFGTQSSNAISSDYYYWKALLLMLNAQPEEALLAFEQVNTGYLNNRPWYTALAHLQAGHHDQAKALFAKIAGEEGPYRLDAAAILKEMQD